MVRILDTRVNLLPAQTALPRNLTKLGLASIFLIFFNHYQTSPPSLINNNLMKSSEQISYEQRIQLAIKAYQNDDWNVSKRKLARQHGIAESTLRDRLKGVKPHQIAHVLQQKLTSKQEDALAHWAILMHS